MSAMVAHLHPRLQVDVHECVAFSLLFQSTARRRHWGWPNTIKEFVHPHPLQELPRDENNEVIKEGGSAPAILHFHTLRKFSNSSSSTTAMKKNGSTL
jgi:hypothetical protein